MCRDLADAMVVGIGHEGKRAVERDGDAHRCVEACRGPGTIGKGGGARAGERGHHSRRDVDLPHTVAATFRRHDEGEGAVRRDVDAPRPGEPRG
eukprot:566706-Prymnesium_polylepis.1